MFNCYKQGVICHTLKKLRTEILKIFYLILFDFFFSKKLRSHFNPPKLPNMYHDIHFIQTELYLHLTLPSVGILKNEDLNHKYR